ncbi:MAG TPA: EF-hand domain-containing protein [Gammaproteobacteria bacterium]|nr:EF-hand domain-containing protein [Gammaproteobacteria bacterium]
MQKPNLREVALGAVCGVLVLTAATATAAQKGHGMEPVFNRHDANGDGVLSRAELDDYLSRRRLPERLQDVWAFDQVDADGDGGVSLDEWTGALGEEMSRRKRGR